MIAVTAAAGAVIGTAVAVVTESGGADEMARSGAEGGERAAGEPRKRTRRTGDHPPVSTRYPRSLVCSHTFSHVYPRSLMQI